VAARFLIFDQDPDIRGLLKDILEFQGYEIFEASDADTALEELAKGWPDVCLAENTSVKGAFRDLLHGAMEYGFHKPFLLLVDGDSIEKALQYRSGTCCMGRWNTGFISHSCCWSMVTP